MNEAPGTAFSFARLYAVILKEFIQLRRDRLTFAMMIGVPLMQLSDVFCRPLA